MFSEKLKDIKNAKFYNFIIFFATLSGKFELFIRSNHRLRMGIRILRIRILRIRIHQSIEAWPLVQHQQIAFQCIGIRQLGNHIRMW